MAEMTGRKGRVVRDSKGHGVYELRAKPDSSEMDSLNVKEAGGLALLCMSLLACKSYFVGYLTILALFANVKR